MPRNKPAFRRILWNEDFLERYARAREAQADKCFQEIIEIADAATPETVNVARLRVDSRKFTVARLAPKKYGDHTQILISCSSAGEDEEFIELSAAPEAARGAPQQGNGNLVRGSGGERAAAPPAPSSRRLVSIFPGRRLISWSGLWGLVGAVPADSSESHPSRRTG